MVDFNRAPGNPAAPKANDKANPAATAATPMMDYADANDMGLGAEQRLNAQAAQRQDNIGMLQSIKSGFRSSVMGAAINKLGAPDFDPDVHWDNSAALAEDARVQQLRPDEDELKYLKQANSGADYNYRWEQIPKVRQSIAEAGANPISGIIGTVGPDIPALLLPGIGEAALGRTAGTALRIAADFYDVSSAIYASDQLGQSAGMNALVAGTGVLDLAHLATRGVSRVAVRAERPIDDVAVEAERAGAADKNVGAHMTGAEAEEVAAKQASGVHPTSEAGTVEGKASDLQVDPDNPVMPKSTRDIDDDLVMADGAVPGKSAEVDLSSLRMNEGERDFLVINGKPTKQRELFPDIPMQSALRRAEQRLTELESTGQLSKDFPKQWRTVMNAIADGASDVPIRFSRRTETRAHYRHVAGETGHVRLSRPESTVGKQGLSADEFIGSMSEKDLRVLLHEAVHAASSRAIRLVETQPGKASPQLLQVHANMETLRKHLLKQLKAERTAGTLSKSEDHYISYYLKNPHEMIAGLGDNQGNYVQFLQRQSSLTGKESALRKLGKLILQSLGVKTSSRTALVDVADAMEDILALGIEGKGLGKQALSKAAPEFASDSMKSMTDAGRKAAKAGNIEAPAAAAMYGQFRQKFNQFFALRDDIARGTDDPARVAFADMLVADGTKVGERSESVVDLKRLLRSEADALTAQVEKAITDQLAENGVGKLQQFFYRKEFVQARRELEQKLAHYLDYAHGEYRAGRQPAPAPAEIQKVVQRYVDSGWAERWHDNLTQSGLLEAGSTVEKSPYYLPRRYSSDKLMRMQREQGLAQKDFVDVFSQAMRDAYPAMDRDLSRQVARTWYQGMTSAQPAQGAAWRRAVNGMSNDEFVETLVENGVSRETAEKILQDSAFPNQATGSSQAKNLRKRNELDLQKEYTSSSGAVIKLGDIMDTDVTKLMNQYNNRMSGRAAFATKGYTDMKDLVNEIDALRPGLAEDAAGWTKRVDDTIDTIMGNPVMGDTPDVLLASGYISNAMMLKNSGLYQLTDLALAAKEFGMARVVRGMFQSGLFKHVRVELGNNAELHGRLNNVLNGSIQNDLRFRWLHTLAEDNTDLTRSAQFTNVARNLSQAAYSANGMRAIHRAMVNLNSGLVRDSILAALGGSAKDAKLLQKFGLREQALQEMRSAYAKDSNAVFKPELQQHLEAVGQRFMDYVVQQNRTGETAHFAEMNPIGRVLIGYQSFAMAATNKILRRHVDNGDYLGLAMVLAYQFPMMALATYAKYGMDGKQSEKSSKDLIMDAVTGMSAIGGASLLTGLFQEQRGGIALTGGVSGIIQTLQGIARKGEMSAQDASKLLPLAQEFIPLRILINNMGD